MHLPEVTDDPYSIFPLVRHAHRTAGFFKVRGVNINLVVIGEKAVNEIVDTREHPGAIAADRIVETVPVHGRRVWRAMKSITRVVKRSGASQ